MKHLMLILISLLLISPVQAAATKHRKPSSVTGSVRDMISTLIRAKDLRINPAATGCKDIEGSPMAKDYTLGDYLSFLMSNLDVTDGQSGIVGECNADTKTHQCEIMFKTGQGTKDPWSYGIRFETDKFGNIVPSSVSCPGVG